MAKWAQRILLLTVLVAPGVGADLRPIPEVHAMPNLGMVLYSESQGVEPDSDVMPRLTIYYTF